jgi:hypothetical protein
MTDNLIAARKAAKDAAGPAAWARMRWETQLEATSDALDAIRAAQSTHGKAPR